MDSGVRTVEETVTVTSETVEVQEVTTLERTAPLEQVPYYFTGAMF